MNAILRIFPRLLLALIIAVSSSQMALARTAPMPVGEMVLCTSQGAVTVAVDAEGNPTGDVHYCPECAAVAFSFIEFAAPDLVVPAANALTLQAPATSLPVPQAACPCPQARGPPLSV